jgi:DNA-binding NarL/FixJ family response regulator
VLLFDVDAAGIAAAAALGRSTGIRLIGVARDPTEELLFDSVEAGLAGLLVRAQVTPATLVECVRTVRLGQGSMPPALLARLVDGLAKGGGRRSGLVGGLAKRELDVLRLLAEGGSTREIAATLAYSERTVKNIVHDVLTKMNCRTRAHAVALATQRGVI